MKRKFILLLLCLSITAVMALGCGSSAAPDQEDTSAQSTQNSDTQASGTDDQKSSVLESAATEEDGTETIMGQVTSIDGNTITLALAEMSQRPDGNGGTPPEGMENPPEDMTPPSEDANDDSQDNDSSTDKSGGAKNGGGFGGINLTGEEKTITLEDSTEILSDNRGESSSASLSDIEEGTTLRVKMKEDTIVSVAISRMGGGRGEKPSSSESEASGQTESSNQTSSEA